MKNKVVWLILVCLIVLILILTSCATTKETTIPTSAVKVTTSVAPPTTSEGSAKPQGELIAALPDFGAEYFIPWKAGDASSEISCLIYDMLIYFDEVNRKFIPGLAESWELSPGALTLTYHLRKGIQFSDGWGEFTSEDLKYNFEKCASPESVAQPTAARNVKSMDTPDPYTLIIHFKKPAPTFFSTFSLGNGGMAQGIASKKYVETVGETAAAQKPIGTGPYRMVDSQTGSYFKFEAVDSHWRVVPEFKNLTVRNVPEISTTVAMLKTKEIDLAIIPAEQMADLKASGLATEASSVGGGGLIILSWGGLVIPEDDRYDPAIHNKDPWVDVRVRKAMSIAIDRQAICETIFAGGAIPAAVPLHSADMDKYQYPYDPAAAKQLLIDAGYPNGFSFEAISYKLRGCPETPRIVEALVGYWQQIGLDPKITVADLDAYSMQYRNPLKNAGKIALNRNSPKVDMLDVAGLQLMPGGMVIHYQDEESYAIWKEGITKINIDERDAYVDKLNQYYYEKHYGPLCNISQCFAWNSAKISPFPHSTASSPKYLEYVRHAEPLNTYRLFTPFPGR